MARFASALVSIVPFAAIAVAGPLLGANPFKQSTSHWSDLRRTDPVRYAKIRAQKLAASKKRTEDLKALLADLRNVRKPLSTESQATINRIPPWHHARLSIAKALSDRHEYRLAYDVHRVRMESQRKNFLSSDEVSAFRKLERRVGSYARPIEGFVVSQAADAFGRWKELAKADLTPELRKRVGDERFRMHVRRGIVTGLNSFPERRAEIEKLRDELLRSR
jgi:hypothetical protein